MRSRPPAALVRSVLVSFGVPEEHLDDPRRIDAAGEILERCAYHEAGHCAAKLALGVRMRIVLSTIDPVLANEGMKPGTCNGRTRHELTYSDEWDQAMATLSGPLAQELYTGDRDGTRDDLQEEWRQARRLSRLSRQRGRGWTVPRLVRETEALLQENWPAVEEIANALLACGTVPGDDLERFLATWARPPGGGGRPVSGRRIGRGAGGAGQAIPPRLTQEV